MKLFDRLEQKSLFVFTRFLSLAVIVILAVGIFVTAVAYSALKKDTWVTLEQVQAALHPDDDKSPASLKEQLPDVTVPPAINEYLGSGKNQKVLLEWLEPLDTDQQADFLQNMSAVIGQAKAHKVEVVDAINQYKTLKLQKLSTSGVDKYAEPVRKGALMLFMAIMMSMVALFSLVLVLLAIERNTRAAS